MRVSVWVKMVDEDIFLSDSYYHPHPLIDNWKQRDISSQTRSSFVTTAQATKQRKKRHFNALKNFFLKKNKFAYINFHQLSFFL
jgi:macrodomain Ter protein organizer (MatP/YcbG family)